MKLTETIQPGPGNPHAVPIAYPAGVSRKYLDVDYTPEKPHPMRRLDVCLPEAGDGPFPLLIYMHGGGLRGRPEK
jgi:acetyl esterase/lipase